MTISTSWEWLESQTIKDLWDERGHKKLIAIQEAYEMLRKHKILALPVYRMEPTNNRVRYTGIVSVFDLLHTIAFQPVFSVIDSFAEQRQLEQSEEALCQPVKKSLYTAESSVSPWIFALETPLSQWIRAFQCHALHRGLVKTESGDMAIVTQTDLIQFLRAHQHQWSETNTTWHHQAVNHLLVSKTRQSLVVLRDTSHALTGFKKMWVHQVSAVAIINERHELVAQLSASDLKGFPLHRVQCIDQPVLLFLEEIYGGVPAPIQCYVTTTIENVADRLLSSNQHHAWVVDESNMPVDVITMSDLIETLK